MFGLSTEVIVMGFISPIAFLYIAMYIASK
jgi:hypothetical protein